MTSLLFVKPRFPILCRASPENLVALASGLAGSVVTDCAPAPLDSARVTIPGRSSWRESIQAAVKELDFRPSWLTEQSTD
jgi:hypothetical protein